jgi:carboxyl-terminal processing protease
MKRDMQTSRTAKIFILALLITTMVLGAYAAGIGTMWFFFGSRTASAEEQAEFGLYWEAWHLVEDHFLGELPELQNVTWGAIQGALGTLDDPYTVFLEPQPRQRERESLEGRFGGIGAYVSQAEDGSIVLDPMPDLPAEQAGVLDGDVVVRVDDTDIAPEMTVDDAVSLIRGEIGSVVSLSLRREGEPGLLIVEIERQEIPTPSVEWRMLEEADGLGYIRIMLFGGRTDTELEDALDELGEQGLNRLIVDLRGNGGGFLDAAVDVASEFLNQGIILYQVEKGQSERAFDAKRGGRYTDSELVLLVDGGTASASEIVAGALRDNGRAVLVGQKTFGKGSVQSVFDLTDGSSVHITSARWLTPARQQLDGEGLDPDLAVEITEEDRSQSRDPQLERAIEYIINGQ